MLRFVAFFVRTTSACLCLVLVLAGFSPAPLTRVDVRLSLQPSSARLAVPNHDGGQVPNGQAGEPWIWGVSTSPRPEQYSATAEPVTTTEQFVAVAPGGAFGYSYIGLASDGTVWVRPVGRYLAPFTLVRGLHGVKAISSNLALTNGGTVWTWQRDDIPPSRVPDLSHVMAIASTSTYFLALRYDGSVWAWSLPVGVPLAHGDGVDSTTPTRIAGLPPIIAIAAGATRSLALASDGSVWYWGFNLGDLGNGATTPDYALVPIKVQGLHHIVAISAGEEHSLALDASGRVWAWGVNSFGELGDGSTSDSTIPVRVPDLPNATAIAAGYQESAALGADGTVWTWGSLEFQKVQLYPTRVAGLDDAKAIAEDVSGGIAIRAAPPVTLTANATPDALRLLNAWRAGYFTGTSNVTITEPLSGASPALEAGDADIVVGDAPLSTTRAITASLECAGTAPRLPVAVGAVAVTYNLPGVRAALRLPPDLLAGLLLGRVREWDDVRVRRTNPGVRLPQLAVRPVYRSDDSQSTTALARYLALQSPLWRTQVMTATGIPVGPDGREAAGSLGVAADVLRTPGALGYVDLADALAHHLSLAALRNRAGRYVVPSIASVEASAQSLVSAMPDSLQQTLADAPAPAAYPLAAYLYLHLCAASSGEVGQALWDFASYTLTTGQAVTKTNFYAPVPLGVRRRALRALDGS